MPMRTSTNTRTLRAKGGRLSGDSGYALATVLGLIVLLTVIAIAGYYVAQQALTESQLVKRESLAFQAANAGIDRAISEIAQRGYNAVDFPMYFSVAEIGSGSATVTAETTGAGSGEYTLKAVGHGPDGSTETVMVRLYMLDLYGMNIAYGSGFNQGTSAGKFNGNASIYGPFYTLDDLRQGDNLGTSTSGGFGWGPIFIKNGTLDVHAGYLVDVKALYVDPSTADPKIVDTKVTRVVRSVPTLKMPRIDTAFLEARYDLAKAESSDNYQGDPYVRETRNTEVATTGDPFTYTGTRAAGAEQYYKLVDNDDQINASTSLTIANTSFGNTNDDFAYNASTHTLTVWGTVFVDGPVSIGDSAANFPVTYVGNGTLMCNGDISLYGDLLPQGGLAPGVAADGNTHPNQSFDPDRVIGIATPGRILFEKSRGGNDKNPDDPPTHAGAFWAGQKIVIDTKVLMCGSCISDGIEVTGNNNMDLRTSANLGKYVPHSMPAYGMLFQSMGGWSRR